jgi:hypothetical protein
MSNLTATSPNKPCSWPITIGAEGITAAQFARCGFDVLVQAGRDKPWYDLVVTKAGNLLKVSVKASEDGRWNLTNGFTRRPADWNSSPLDCRGSVDMWLNSHGSRAVCCLVQFDGVAINQMPRMYLASPFEIAQKMHETVDRLGHCALYEQYAWTSPEGVEAIELLPSNWMFSPERIQELLAQHTAGVSSIAQVPKSGAVPRLVSPAADKPREIALSA